MWLDEHLLAAVAHRQVVLTLPKRLRGYFLHDRRRLGHLSRVASRTLRAYMGAALGESDAVPGVISLAQSFGSLAHWHPHLHVLVTDGAFRRDGTFVAMTAHDRSGGPGERAAGGALPRTPPGSAQRQSSFR